MGNRMTLGFRCGHPRRNLQLRAVLRDYGLRTIGAPRLARDRQRLTVKWVERVVNRDVRTHGIVAAAASTLIFTSSPPRA